MQWKKFEEPKLGLTRVVKYFALSPKTLSDGYVVWLEKYNCLEKFYIQGKDWETAYWKPIKTWRTNGKEPVIDDKL